MSSILTITGLPHSLSQDGWWLPAAPADQRGGGQSRPAGSNWRHTARVLMLVMIADLLFWRHAPGASLAVFALAVFGAATADIRPRRQLLRPLILLILAAAPVIEMVQFVSVLFLILGFVISLVWARRPGASAADLLGLATGLLRDLPHRWINAKLLQSAKPKPAAGNLRRQLRDWAFPLAGTLILMGLLMQANPVLAKLLELDLDLWAMLTRITLWSGIALLVVPFLSPLVPEPATLPATGSVPLHRFGINAGSVLRALVLFNLMIGLQSLTDLSILTGGANLPSGMSLAEYAHRGAYPLLAAALLAGAFALAARPFLHEHRLIRPLLLLWIAQNMVLCGGAMLRLDHYIDAFGLTYLRIHAFIWMGLVAAGLGLMLVQIMRARSSEWLVWRAAALGLCTLYLCSFVNFAQIIAEQNLSRPRVDGGYLCRLGPMAHVPVADAERQRPGLDFIYVRHCPALIQPESGSWQEWGFRAWRVRRYALSNQTDAAN